VVLGRAHADAAKGAAVVVEAEDGLSEAGIPDFLLL
jgi:hypothetical protein